MMLLGLPRGSRLGGRRPGEVHVIDRSRSAQPQRGIVVCWLAESGYSIDMEVVREIIGAERIARAAQALTGSSGVSI